MTTDMIDATAPAQDEARATRRKPREWVRCGVPCAVCGKDEWFLFQGFKRCDCGQHLWVERKKDARGDTRFPMAQGPSLPQEYQGWLAVTE